MCIIYIYIYIYTGYTNQFRLASLPWSSLCRLSSGAPTEVICALQADSSRGPSVRIGTIWRRLARPLRKDGTHESRSVDNVRFVGDGISAATPAKSAVSSLQIALSNYTSRVFLVLHCSAYDVFATCEGTRGAIAFKPQTHMLLCLHGVARSKTRSNA